MKLKSSDLRPQCSIHRRREPCFVCEKHETITEAHHVMPLKDVARIMSGCGRTMREPPIVWLCPNCHTYLHGYEAIMARALARVPSDVDKREGSVIYDAMAPLAVELAEIALRGPTAVQHEGRFRRGRRGTNTLASFSYTRKNPCYTRNEKKDKRAGMLHSTATPGASAAAILDSMDSPTAGAAVEYAIDPTGIYQGLPLGIKSGHCGASANSTHVGVELCEPEETIFLPINWKPLSQGGKYNRAYAVKRLQQELVALGFDPKGVDGSFGPGCAAAVKAYQKSAGLGADGSVGPATLKSLQRREGSRLRYDAAVAQTHFDKVYGYAVGLFAWLMEELGGRAEEIVCHSEGYKLGIASNHADVLRWFPAHGKSMDTFRADVKAAMAGEKPGDPLGEAVDKLASKGVIDSPDYWKGGLYSAANVQALIVKMASYIN